MAMAGVDSAMDHGSWHLDRAAGAELFEELGLKPIAWCETPTGDLDASRGADTGVAAMGTAVPSGSQRVVRAKARKTAKKSPLRRRPEPWNSLSTELILHIFKQLGQQDLASCARVCKFWRELAYDETLWRKMVVNSKRVTPAIIFGAIQRNPRWLRISNCDLADFDEDELSKAPIPSYRSTLSLSRIDLCNTRVLDNDIIPMLSMAPKLKTLDLSSCFTITDKTLRAVAECCPHLEALSVRMADKISALGIEAVATECPKLRVLSVGWTKGTLGCGASIASHCDKLEYLDMSGLSFEVTDDLMKEIIARAPRLKVLDLSDCYTLTNQTIVHVCEGLPAIEHVSMSRCHHITSEPMWQLARIPTLKSINLIGCFAQIDSHIRGECPHLKVNQPQSCSMPPFM